MHNGTDDGVSGVTIGQEEVRNGIEDAQVIETAVDQPLTLTNGASDVQPPLTQQECEPEQNGFLTPPAKRRKLAIPEPAKLSRAISPPWKQVKVEGPSTFVEGGIRKSARTNYVPLDLQPHSDKRKTRGTIHHNKPPSIKSKYGGVSASGTGPASSSSRNSSSDARRHSFADRSATAQSNKMSAKRRSLQLQSKQSPRTSTALSNHVPKHRSLHHARSASALTSTSNPTPPRRVGRPRRSSLIRDHISSTANVNGWHKEPETPPKPTDTATSPENSAKKTPRLSLRFTMPGVGFQHPQHLVRRPQIGVGEAQRPKFASFEDWLDKEGRLGLEGDVDPRVSKEDAEKEALLLQRMTQAAEPGGVLSRDRCTYWQPAKPDPPPRFYTHQDRLLAHMKNFHMLLGREKARHLRTAKEIAQHAAAFVRVKQEQSYRAWKKDQPKTAEEIAQEQREMFKNIYEQLVFDMKRKWLMVGEVIDGIRLQRWQSEQDRLGKEALNEAIEQSKGLLSKRRRRFTSGSDSQEMSDSEGLSGSGSDVDSDEEGISEDEDNMSSSNSESENEGPAADDDAGLTQEELRQKYLAIQAEEPIEPAEHQSSRPSSLSPSNREQSLLSPDETMDTPVELEDVDDILMDDSSESSDFDDSDESDDGSSGDDQSASGEEDEEEEASGFGALGGFLSRKEREVLMAKAQEAESSDEHEQEVAVEPRPPSEFGMTDDEADKVSLIPDITQGPTPEATPQEDLEMQYERASPSAPEKTDATPVHEETAEEQDTIISPEAAKQFSKPESLEFQAVEEPATPVSTQTLKTPVPSLLRGTLREYQHFGLDWLAGLYGNGTNGILADEMGLGKTIQTIALLGHLAVHYEIWGPHLIVVPTSVMLNWEMEFKKFLPGFKVLTYYGTQEERRRKRAGWMDDDKWNVWITSYTLITQDQQIFKRKAWHYMILDEAHNIKNFQSMRWQTLLTFRTRARLLLTGTPLQNSLTELWSLLYFLMPSDDSGTGIAGFTSLDEFTSWFRKPTEQILEQGKETLDSEARVAVRKLHDILRPYLLRRLKADVEKQMPGKYEHVVYCRLSKRQRYLYDGFMSRAQTRETLASGNTFSIMNALMQLRKVCNHPDLFETRQIVTSFAMPRSTVADFEIKELLVRRRLLQADAMKTVDLNLVNLLPGSNERMSALDTIQRQRLGALGVIRQLTSQQRSRVNWKMPFDGSSVDSTLACFENNARRLRYDRLHQTSYLTSLRSQRRPLFSYSLMDRLRSSVGSAIQRPRPSPTAQTIEWMSQRSNALDEMVPSLPERSAAMETTVKKFACTTPAVVATDMAPLTLSTRGVEVVQEAKRIMPQNPYHEAQMCLSIAFPDKRLLQFDCGKLQKLDGLLRQLQAGGHRALIFTQMTRVLDILEQFMNIHGHRYLRLDGATKLEQRQILTERFNNDDRILAFILSSRSGGIGINLTGADTVIFYDLDWNPAMDKQCQDRCHRIGQTRDVHIYRLVSEHTIEANILRKANQKRMLDDVVIQEGEFTTDYFNSMSVKDIVGEEAFEGVDDDVANAAMDRVLGTSGPTQNRGRLLEAVEDQEDAQAAKEAEKEIARYDAEDFDEQRDAAASAIVNSSRNSTGGANTPRNTGGVETSTTLEAAESGLIVHQQGHFSELNDNDPARYIEELPSSDDYMIRFLDWELRDVAVLPPGWHKAKAKKKKKKGGKEALVRKR